MVVSVGEKSNKTKKWERKKKEKIIVGNYVQRVLLIVVVPRSKSPSILFAMTTV